MHWGIVIAVIVAVGVAVLFRYSIFGFRLRMLGAGPRASRRAGLNINRLSLAVMALSGAIGGLAGASLVLGDRFRILDGISPGFGYIAILVALLARSSPLGAIFAAALFAGLQLGGQSMEAAGAAPQALVLMMQGLIVLAIAGAVEIERRWQRRMAQA
jgi:simple sugar transport system permease protein